MKHLFKVTISNVQYALKAEDELRNLFKCLPRDFSFTNKTDVDKLRRLFMEKTILRRSELKELGLLTGEAIVDLITDNKVMLEAMGWDFSKIKTFRESERRKEYKKWKASDRYTAGKRINLSTVDELRRTLVVYDANNPTNPETTLEYEFVGVIGGSFEQRHQVYMIKSDWHYATGLDYFSANPCLLCHYVEKYLK